MPLSLAREKTYAQTIQLNVRRLRGLARKELDQALYSVEDTMGSIPLYQNAVLANLEKVRFIVVLQLGKLRSLLAAQVDAVVPRMAVGHVSLCIPLKMLCKVGGQI